MFKETAVFGAGAVGSFLGARLSRVLPTLLVTRGGHLAAMKAKGLRLGGLLEEHVTLGERMEVRAEMRPLGPDALLVVAVKARDLENAAEAVAPFIRPDTLILCIQNGLDPETRLSRALAALGREANVKRVLVSAGCDLIEPGVVHYWGGGLAFPEDEGLKPAAGVFKSAGVPVEFMSDFKRAVWLKFAVNCVVNPLTAVLGVRNREVAREELAPIRGAVLDEVRRAAAADGVELGDDLDETVVRAMAQSNNRSSMLQDVLGKKPTEIDEFAGELVRRTDGPAGRLLLGLVRFIESARRGNQRA